MIRPPMATMWQFGSVTVQKWRRSHHRRPSAKPCCAIVTDRWQPEAGLTVKQDQQTSGAQPLAVEAVPKSLAGLVSRIVSYEAEAAIGTGDREIASFEVPVIFSFADPFRIAFDRAPRSDERIGSFVSGLHPGFVEIVYGGSVSCLQINLTPIGARLFFRRPMTEFATRLVSLEDVEDRGLLVLRDRLGAASPYGRLRIAAAFLEQRLLGHAADRETAFIWSAIQASRGTLRIDQMSDALGWSRKKLAARSRDAFGLTPKKVSRIARFHHAMEIATAEASRPDWAGIAADCGYVDQAHLVRDFTTFAGRPPLAWRRHSDENGRKQIYNQFEDDRG